VPDDSTATDPDNNPQPDDTQADTIPTTTTPDPKVADDTGPKGVTFVVSDDKGKEKEPEKEPEKVPEPVPITVAPVTSKKTIDAIVAELQEVYKDPVSCVKSNPSPISLSNKTDFPGTNPIIYIVELGWDAEGKVLAIQLSTEDNKTLKLTMVLGDDYPTVRPITLLDENCGNLDNKKVDVSYIPSSLSPLVIVSLIYPNLIHNLIV